MKKILLLSICLLSLCGCNNKKEQMLDCTKKESESTNITTDNTISYYSINGEIDKICSKTTTIFTSAELASETYNRKLDLTIQYDLVAEDCKLDYRTITCTSCNNNAKNSFKNSKDRGTILKDKSFFEGEGYSCTIKDTNE